ncbi:MAG TPA: ABC transporter permease [Syntrophobacteraceae bacterium]|nr:ABC transporter permease [Syntrophobacteraceae bacterium]
MAEGPERDRRFGPVILFLQHLTSIAYLFRETLRWMLVKPFQGKPLRVRAIIAQMDEVGVKSIPIVFLVSFVIGIILVLQTAYQLEKFGAVTYAASLASVALTREMAPLLTAIVLAGRVSAAFTAELGTMLVTEEILALEVMAIAPVAYLVVPRFIAMLVMLPCLTALADVVGMFGGYVVGTTAVGIRSTLYIQTSLDALLLKDILTGLFKSFVFAGIIAMVGCYMAFVVRGGAEGVGRSTMISVVTSLISIIIADCFFTTVFFLFL